jgi:hypothetical protein
MVISGVAHVAKELSEDRAAPPTDKTLQHNVRVGAMDAEVFEAGHGLGDDILAGGGVKPVTGDGEVKVADLRVGSNQGITVPSIQHGQDRMSGRVVKTSHECSSTEGWLTWSSIYREGSRPVGQ